MAFVFADFSVAVTSVRTYANAVNGLFAGLVTARTNLISSLEDKSYTYQISTAEQIGSAAIAGLENIQRQLIALSSQIILDRAHHLELFPEVTNESDVGEVLKAIFDFMIVTADTVPKNTVTLSAITKTTAATTAGNVYNTLKLPGNIAPGAGYVQHHALFGLDSELPESDSFVAICRSQGYLMLSGRPAANVPYGEATVYGNAGYITLDGLGSGNLVSNLFENFTTVNIPDGWTINSGAAGTEVKEDAVANNVFAGAKSLRLEGTSNISFPIASLVSPRQNLLLSVNLKKGTGTTSGTYKLQMTGTGMADQETAAFNATDLSTATWTEKTLHCAVPAAIPSDLKIRIVTTAVDTTDGIYLDGGIMQPYVYWAGTGWAATQGTTPFILGDKFTGTITNDKAGVVQTLIVRHHGIQLPSA